MQRRSHFCQYEAECRLIKVAFVGNGKMQRSRQNTKLTCNQDGETSPSIKVSKRFVPEAAIYSDEEEKDCHRLLKNDLLRRSDKREKRKCFEARW